MSWYLDIEQIANIKDQACRAQEDHIICQIFLWRETEQPTVITDSQQCKLYYITDNKYLNNIIISIFNCILLRRSWFWNTMADQPHSCALTWYSDSWSWEWLLSTISVLKFSRSWSFIATSYNNVHSNYKEMHNADIVDNKYQVCNSVGTINCCRIGRRFRKYCIFENYFFVKWVCKKLVVRHLPARPLHVVVRRDQVWLSCLQSVWLSHNKVSHMCSLSSLSSLSSL